MARLFEEIVPLRILFFVFDRKAIQKGLDGFSCKRDSDVIAFLQRYAINNELNGSSRSYLVIDEEEYQSGRLKVAAFFTPVTIFLDIL